MRLKLILGVFLGFGFFSGYFYDSIDKSLAEEAQEKTLSEKEISKLIKKLKTPSPSIISDVSQTLLSGGGDLTGRIPEIVERLEGHKNNKTKLFVYKLLVDINPQSQAVNEYSYLPLGHIAESGRAALQIAVDPLIKAAKINDFILEKIVENFDQNPQAFGYMLSQLGPRGGPAVQTMVKYLGKEIPAWNELLGAPPQEKDPLAEILPPGVRGIKNQESLKTRSDDLAAAVFALGKAGEPGLEAKPLVFRLARIMFEDSASYRPATFAEPDNYSDREAPLHSSLRYLLDLQEYDSSIPEFLEEEIPGAPPHTRVAFAMLVPEYESTEIYSKLVAIVRAGLASLDSFHRFQILWAMQQGGYIGAEEKGFVQELRNRDLRVMDISLVYPRQVSGGGTIKMDLFNKLQQSDLIPWGGTPEFVFAAVETDKEIVRDFLFKGLDHPDWVYRVNALQAFSAAGLKDPEIVSKIISYWGKNDVPGDVAIIRTLGKIGSSENGALAFLESLRFEEGVGPNPSPMQNEVNLALQEIRTAEEQRP